MVASVVRRTWHRLRINGAEVALAEPPLQNEGLEGQLTTVVDLPLAGQPALASGMPVDLYQVDLAANTMVAQFAGFLNHRAADHFPGRVALTCTGPLARLRRAPQVDIDLSGKTDGQAAQYVLAFCGISVTPSDIQDAGYVLGAQTPVLWRQDQPGAQMAAELDRVFGMATIEVGAGRVVRFAYDKVSSVGDAAATYISGQNATLWRLTRDLGDLDAIHNVWQIRGASWQDADNCSLTVWARAVADHPKLGPGVYTPAQSFASELIQDEALARAVASRLMRWTNREPDELIIETANDPQIGPGRVVAVKDTAYGIDLGSATAYRVLTVDRLGGQMTLHCVGGAAGAVGTLTSGVDRVCNDTHFAISLPGSFSVPAFRLPPFPAIEPFPGPGPLPLPPFVPVTPPVTCDLQPQDRGWTCGTTDLSAMSAWATTAGYPEPVSHPGGGFDLPALCRVQANGAATNALIETGWPPSWELIGSFTLLSRSAWLQLGLAGADHEYVELGGPDSAVGLDWPLDINQPIQCRLAFNAATNEFTVETCQHGHHLTHTSAVGQPGAVGPFPPYFWAGNAAETGTAVTVSGWQMSRDCDEGTWGWAACGKLHGEAPGLAAVATSGELVGHTGWIDSIYNTWYLTHSGPQPGENIKDDPRWTTWQWNAAGLDVETFLPHGNAPNGLPWPMMQAGYTHYPLPLAKDQHWRVTVAFWAAAPCEVGISVGRGAADSYRGGFTVYTDGTGFAQSFASDDYEDLTGLPWGFGGVNGAAPKITLSLEWDGVDTLTMSAAGEVVATFTSDTMWDDYVALDDPPATLYPGVSVVAAIDGGAPACLTLATITSFTVEFL